MTAHFYIMAESFSNNTNFSLHEIEEKVKRLAEDVSLINRYKKSNKLYANYNDVYPQIFYKTYTVEDFLCRAQDLKRQGVDRDVINALQNIFQKSMTTTITSKEVRNELFEWTDDTDCHGLIAFHKIDGIDDTLQIIYGIDGWYKFRRYFLGSYPKNGEFFIDECCKYFPRLYFHQRNKTTVSSILKNSSQKIVHHLAELNDKYHLCKTTPYSRVETLKKFNSMCNFDQDASPEGNTTRKKDLSWKFINHSGVEKSVYCEIHLKLLLDDSDKVSTDRRIYFHEGKKDIQNGKILVGHIGNHQ